MSKRVFKIRTPSDAVLDFMRDFPSGMASADIDPALPTIWTLEKVTSAAKSEMGVRKCVKC